MALVRFTIACSIFVTAFVWLFTEVGDPQGSSADVAEALNCATYVDGPWFTGLYLSAFSVGGAGSAEVMESSLGEG